MATEKKTAKKKAPAKKKTTKSSATLPKKVRKRSDSAIPKITAAEAKVINDNATPRFPPKTLATVVRFRDIDLDRDLLKFIRKVTKRANFKDESDATMAMLEYLAHFVSKRGVGSFVPHLKNFRKKR
jgi:hypothetical protein